MYEKAILGFLRLRPLTTYDLAQAMKKSTSFFYSASQGSIHPALQRLLRDELVTCAEEVENGRNKKRYTITQAGEEAFQSWLGSDLDVGKVKDEALLRLFFLGALPPAERRRVLAGYRGALVERMAELEELQVEARARAELVPEQLRDVASYQLHTLELGVDYYRFMLDWFARFDDDKA